MDAPDGFKAPQSVAQDLLLIQELVGKPPTIPKVESNAVVEKDRKGSPASIDSEEEVKADLNSSDVEEESDSSDDSSSSSLSESESDSSSDSESIASERPELPAPGVKDAGLDLEEAEGDESGVTQTIGYMKTPHELTEVNVTIPHIQEVAPEETLEKIGEVMSVLRDTVIVRGIPTPILGRASEKALDSDTLLVLEDRRVLGYVYETFGPTHQPLYQVKFNETYPLEPGKVQVTQAIFHVPQWSNFVFLSELKRVKGSDASNLHDEEPGEHELEFSDDEAEAAYRRSIKLKRKRGDSRASSTVPSRFSTPTPSQMRDQDMTAYQDYDPYDDNKSAGSSRRTPVPYDDPYSDPYEQPAAADSLPYDDVTPNPPSVPIASSSGPLPTAAAFLARERPSQQSDGSGNSTFRQRGRGRGEPRRGRGADYHRTRDGSRGSRGDFSNNFHSGRGRGRGGERNRSASDSWQRSSAPHTYGHPDMPPHPHNPSQARSLSPTSQAIARATGQYTDRPYDPRGAPEPAALHPMYSMHAGYSPQDTSYAPEYPYGHNYGAFASGLPQVQPHINPRFAGGFAMTGAYNQAFAPPGNWYQPAQGTAWEPASEYEVKREDSAG